MEEIYFMKKNLNKAAAFLCVVIGGLGWLTAISQWIVNSSDRDWLIYTRSGTNFIIGSIFSPLACTALIVFGILMLLGILKGKAFNIILIVAAALSSVWFANTLQMFLAAAVIVFFVASLFKSEEQGEEEQGGEWNTGEQYEEEQIEPAAEKPKKAAAPKPKKEIKEVKKEE